MILEDMHEIHSLAPALISDTRMS